MFAEGVGFEGRVGQAKLEIGAPGSLMFDWQQRSETWGTPLLAIMSGQPRCGFLAVGGRCLEVADAARVNAQRLLGRHCLRGP